MAESEIMFVPLGGGDNIGASCYYLKLGRSNILLDCGKGFDEDKISFSPNFYTLLKFIDSLDCISQVYISHAHLDHVGALPEFLSDAPHCAVYMTQKSLILAAHQFNKNINKNLNKNINKLNKNNFAHDILINRVTPVSFDQSFKFKFNNYNYAASFYPAGHIPGAMMTLFEYRDKYKIKNILYTGDYSLRAQALSGECVLPDANKDIDILIICAVNARQNGKFSYNSLDIIIDRVKSVLKSGRNAYCFAPQLSKGIELLKALNVSLHKKFKIYIDEAIFDLIKKFEVTEPIIDARDYYINEAYKDFAPHVILSANRYYKYMNEDYRFINANFSLHDDFDLTVKFIKRINPKTAVIVHCDGSDKDLSLSVEQELMLDADCRTQFIFAENNQAYYL